MMQRWREKLKYIEAGLIVTSLIMFVVSLFVDYENTGLEAAILIIGTAVISVIAEKINKKRNRENETPGRGRTERYYLRINPVSQRKND